MVMVPIFRTKLTFDWKVSIQRLVQKYTG